MLGLGDFNVSLVFILIILSSLLCVIYGIVNWNKGLELTEDEIKEEIVPEEELKETIKKVEGNE